MSNEEFPSKFQLSKNFLLSEFLRSNSFPPLKNYRLSISELKNLNILVNMVLQPARDKFGPITILHGGRPENLVNKQGKTFAEVLKENGFEPAKNSDHEVFLAADIRPVDTNMLVPLFNWLEKNPYVRQVILYEVSRVPNRIHVAAIGPGFPKIKGNNFAFIKPVKK